MGKLYPCAPTIAFYFPLVFYHIHILGHLSDILQHVTNLAIIEIAA